MTGIKKFLKIRVCKLLLLFLVPANFSSLVQAAYNPAFKGNLFDISNGEIAPPPADHAKKKQADKKEDKDQAEDKSQETEDPGEKEKISKEGKEGWQLQVFGTTNYVWRGLSQTYNYPALQGELTYIFHGLYVDLFSSNVYFHNQIDEPSEGDPRDRDRNIPEPESESESREPLPPEIVARRSTLESIEVDPSIGFAHEFKNGLGFDVGVVRYTYPNANHEYDYNESYLSVNYKILTFLVGYTNDVFAERRPGVYYNLALEYPIPEKWFRIKDLKFGASAGYYHLPREVAPCYTDYSLSLAKEFTKNLTGRVVYTFIHGLPQVPAVRPHLFGQLEYSFS